MSTIEINVPDMPSAEDLAQRLGTDEWMLGMPASSNGGKRFTGWSASQLKDGLVVSEWRWTEEDPEWKQTSVLSLPASSLADMRRFLGIDLSKSAMFQRDPEE